MLKLGDKEFRWMASSGALGWAGGDEGHGFARAWKWPFRVLGLLDPKPFLVVLKTLTREPKKGNLTFWRPWRAVRLIKGGTANAVGLTNPGVDEWVARYSWKLAESKLNAVVSLAADTSYEMTQMIGMLERTTPCLLGYELNLSCPNVEHAGAPPEELFDAARVHTGKPVGVKLGFSDWQYVAARLRETPSWYHLINAMPWSQVFGEQPSPLTKYGYDGGVSGKPLVQHAKDALKRYKLLGYKTPVVSGGGVMDVHEARNRFCLGADAVALGTVFLKAPWRANRIIREVDGNG